MGIFDFFRSKNKEQTNCSDSAPGPEQRLEAEGVRMVMELAAKSKSDGPLASARRVLGSRFDTIVNNAVGRNVAPAIQKHVTAASVPSDALYEAILSEIVYLSVADIFRASNSGGQADTVPFSSSMLKIKPGECFKGSNDNWPELYGKCYETIFPGLIRARIYTPRAKMGDNGTFPISAITSVISEKQFVTEFEDLCERYYGK